MIGPLALGRIWRRDDRRRGDAQRSRGENIFPLLEAQRLAAREPRHVEPFDRADGDEDQREIAAEHHHEDDDEKDEGQRIEDLDDAHHHGVDGAAGKAGDCTIGDADDERDDGGEQPDREGDAARDQGSRQKVAAIGVGPEQKNIFLQRDRKRQPAPLLRAGVDAGRGENIRALEDP